jgi:hypothetical protein
MKTQREEGMKKKQDYIVDICQAGADAVRVGWGGKHAIKISALVRDAETGEPIITTSKNAEKIARSINKDIAHTAFETEVEK